MHKKKVVIFNGSPRKKGTSYSFARTMVKLIEEEGSTAEIIHIIEYLDRKKDFADIKKAIAQSDVIGLSMPLYVDTLPYPTLWFLEKIEEECSKNLQGKGFFAIGQSGFPDITLFGALLGSCRCFAEATKMKWLGGLGYGGGAIIDGTLMENLGKKGEKITDGFRIAIRDVLQGRIISPEAQKMITVNVPKILYRPLAAYLNHNARKIGRKYGVTDVGRKAYLEDI